MDVLVTGGTGRLGQRLLGPLQGARGTRCGRCRGAAPDRGRGDVEFGGPEDLSAADLLRTWAAARAPGAHVVATPVPGKLSAAFRDGAAVPSGGARGRRTYAQHLAG